jgi:hypothetical protein
VVENEAKCCRSASRIKGSKKGAGRGVMISVLVGCERRERREELDDRLDEETTGIGGVLWMTTRLKIYRVVELRRLSECSERSEHAG